MDIRSTVLTMFEAVAKEQRKKLAPLTDTLPLSQSGMDSLCMAVMVTRLEDRLGFDPFDTDEGADFPVTIGDFVKIYEDAAGRVG